MHRRNTRNSFFSFNPFVRSMHINNIQDYSQNTITFRIALFNSGHVATTRGSAHARVAKRLSGRHRVLGRDRWSKMADIETSTVSAFDKIIDTVANGGMRPAARIIRVDNACAWRWIRVCACENREGVVALSICSSNAPATCSVRRDTEERLLGVSPREDVRRNDSPVRYRK